MDIRIGHGFDIHRLVEGRELLLAGIPIPHDKGLLGHSDGDAVLHAVCDALLGAVGAGDIGTHFPDTAPAHRGAASAGFVAGALRKAREQGYHVGNADVTVFAEQPRLQPHMNRMRRRLAEILEVDESRVNLKAKTMEGLGAVGRGDAIAATAVVLVRRAP